MHMSESLCMQTWKSTLYADFDVSSCIGKANTDEKVSRPRDISEIISRFLAHWICTNFSILNCLHVFDILLLTHENISCSTFRRNKFNLRTELFLFKWVVITAQKRASGWKNEKIQTLTPREFFFACSPEY
jgi:hypothetical protein